MRIACVSTVRNEEDLILPNIRYHRFLGVTDFFVFLDRSSDGTRGQIESVPDLRIFQDSSYRQLRPYVLDRPELDPELIRQCFSTHPTIRQVCNVNMALESCRAEGIDWLLCLDPDELVCLDETRAEEGSLQRALGALDDSVGAVSFRNLEVVPTRMEVRFAFEDRLFKNPGLDGSMPGLPKSRLFNPFTGSDIPAGWFWGHSSGKAALRPRPGAYFTSTHRGCPAGETVAMDWLLHYNIFSFRQLLNKYRNFSDSPDRPGARPLRTLLKKVVNDGFPEEFLAEYYRRHIRYSQEEIEQIRQMAGGAFREIQAAANFFSGLDQTA